MSTQAKKARLKEQREKGLCEIDDFCSINKLEKEQINEYQVRVYGHNEKEVDLYPTNKKYCRLGTIPVWGMYSKLDELLNYLK